MAADNRSDLYPCFVRYCSARCWISLNIQATIFSAWLVPTQQYRRLHIPEAGNHQRKSEDLSSCNSVVFLL